jgi:hypothetical protein
VDKIVPLRNNAILLESRCSSILSLPNNKTLKSLNLVADCVAQTCRNTWRLKKSRMKFTNKTICQAQFRIISLKMRSKPDKPKTAQTRGLSNSTPGHFMKTGKIYIHWKSLNIKDYIRVTRCYNCQKYGYVSKFCKSEKQCGFCASTTHETKKLHGQRQPREAQMCELCPEQTK